MQVLVTYDVTTETAEGRKRLRKVAQACKNYGQRVQKSVFECRVDEAQFETMIRGLLKCINEDEDSLRVYHLREPKSRYVREYGVTRTVDFDDTLVL